MPLLTTVCVDFEVRRDDLATRRTVESVVPEAAKGEVVFEVEQFGFSANNITYGLLGDQLQYWSLFPAEDGWGRLPVWGYLRVVASRAPGFEPGRRAYGLCPMSTHVRMVPGRLTEVGFVDVVPHRRSLPAVYNAYSWLNVDSAYQQATAELSATLRPVFWLSFMVDDYLAEGGHLADHGHHSRADVVVTSASSRAAIGIGYLLRQRGIRTVGLTSSAKLDFVRSLGVYDEIHSYDELDHLGAIATAILVDVAGHPDLRARVRDRCGSALRQTVSAGFTHQDPTTVADEAADTTFVFAPQRIVDRARQIGFAALNERYVASLSTFTAWCESWLRVIRSIGPAAVEAAYARVLTNAATPADAAVLSLRTVVEK